MIGAALIAVSEAWPLREADAAAYLSETSAWAMLADISLCPRSAPYCTAAFGSMSVPRARI